MSESPPPVLILASRESGGSLLSAVLGAHPAFHGAPQLNVLAFEFLWQHIAYAQVPRDSNLHGLFRFVGAQLVGEQTVQSVQAAQRWLNRRSKATAGEIHAELCHMVAPKRLVDYSPLCAQNGEAARRALASVPGATVIHLTRNPFAHGRAMCLPVWQTVTLSLDFWDRRGRLQPCMDLFEIGEQLIDWSVSPPVFDPQFAWYRTQNAVRGALAELPDERIIRISLETLLARPAQTLTGLLDRLGAASDDITVQRMLGAGVPDYARPGPYHAPFGVDFEMLDRSVAAALGGGNPAADRLRADRPLPWRGDGEALLPEVVALAEDLGYSLAS